MFSNFLDWKGVNSWRRNTKVVR